MSLFFKVSWLSIESGSVVRRDLVMGSQNNAVSLIALNALPRKNYCITNSSNYSFCVTFDLLAERESNLNNKLASIIPSADNEVTPGLVVESFAVNDICCGKTI